MSHDDIILETKSLAKTYQMNRHAIEVLCGIDLKIRRGEWISLVGRSGCGKTTLLHLLGMLDTPTRGELFLEGAPYSRMDSRGQAAIRQKRIGFVFQSYHLLPELTALENVMLPGRQWFASDEKLRRQGRTLLEGFGLGARLGHRPQELSGGEQQRVAIARALINTPDILLADEPTGNLDTQAGGEILAILKNLHREGGRTLILVTHDKQVANLADAIYRIADGRCQPETT